MNFICFHLLLQLCRSIEFDLIHWFDWFPHYIIYCTWIDKLYKVELPVMIPFYHFLEVFLILSFSGIPFPALGWGWFISVAPMLSCISFGSQNVDQVEKAWECIFSFYCTSPFVLIKEHDKDWLNLLHTGWGSIMSPTWLAIRQYHFVYVLFWN